MCSSWFDGYDPDSSVSSPCARGGGEPLSRLCVGAAMPYCRAAASIDPIECVGAVELNRGTSACPGRTSCSSMGTGLPCTTPCTGAGIRARSDAESDSASPAAPNDVEKLLPYDGERARDALGGTRSDGVAASRPAGLRRLFSTIRPASAGGGLAA